MSVQTVVIQADQPNVVSVNVSSTPVVEVLCPTPQVVEVCSNVQINNYVIEQGDPGGGNGGSGDCCDLQEPIDVTNLDTAIGNALGAYYPQGTTLEKILRDILEPDVAPDIDSLQMGLTVSGGATTYFSSDQTFEWGTVVSLQRLKFTLDDSGEFFDETQKIKSSGSFYAPQPQFPLSDYLLYENWHELPANEVFPPSHINGYSTVFDYQSANTYVKSFNGRLSLGYKLSDGDTGTAYSPQRSVTFAKKNWLISSPADIVGGDVFSSLNDLISSSGSAIMDEGLTTSSNFSLTTDDNSSLINNYVYVAIPYNLTIDVNLGPSVQVGAFNVGQSFIYVGQFTYITGLPGGATYEVKLYQSNQPKPYSPNQTLNIFAN